jgi:chromosome partitioning protein
VKNVKTSIYECIVDELDPRKIILNTEIPGLDIIPSHIDLVGAEIEMLNLPNREKVLRHVIEKIRSDYDFILIDCSPSLGLITVNSLTAADSVIIPVQCEYFALEGLGKLLNTIKIIQSKLHPDLEIEGFLLTMYDSRLNLSNQVQEEVKKHFQDMVFESVIQRNIKLSEAPSFGQPAILYDATSKGAASYMNLAREILQNNGLTKIKNSEKIIE